MLRPLFAPIIGLSLLGSFYGAVVCASAAFDALFCINNVLAVAFLDSFYRAVLCASTTADASIGNYICHCLCLLG